MKKKILSVLLIAAMAVTMCIGCGNGKSDSAATDAKQENSTAKSDNKQADAKEADSKGTVNTEDGLIGIALPSADHGWMAGCIYSAQEEVKALGLEEGTGYKILTSDSVNDQANDIEELISLGCTSIVLLPHNDEVSVAAQKIMDANINLIVFDRKVTGDYTAYLAGDNAGLGREGAKYLGDVLEGKGTIAVMSAPSVGSVSVERTEAFTEEMEKSFPDMKLIQVTADGFTQEAGLKMATDMLVANPEIDAVFSIDDEPSLGILKAVQEAGRTDIKYISGGGGAQAWYQKIQSEDSIHCFTETYSPSMIADAIALAQKIQQGGEFEKDTILEPETVDSSNVADYINADSPY